MSFHLFRTSLRNLFSRWWTVALLQLVTADGYLKVNFTVLWDGQSLRAQENRAASNDLIWSLAA